MTYICKQCRRTRAASTALLRQRTESLLRGLEVVRRGGTYDEAARVAGYADGFKFSRACKNMFGHRPREMAS